MTLSTVRTIIPKLRLVGPHPNQAKQCQDVKPRDKQFQDARATDQLPLDAKPDDRTVPCGFFKLPGEIKNQIYELVFDPCDYEITWLKGSRTLTHLTYKFDRRGLDQTKPWGLWGSSRLKSMAWILKVFTAPKLGPNTVANRRLLRKPRSSRPHLEANLGRAHIRAALLLTCRAIHNEAVSMFYSAQSFGFANHGLLEHFLSTINPTAKASITRLFLEHGTYGDPYWVADIPWKTVYDDKWAVCCAEIAFELVSLREVHLLLRINDHPVQWNLKDRWVGPLRSLADKGLKVFDLELLRGVHNSKTDPCLKGCAREVRKVILGCEYDEVADEAAEERKRLAIEFPVQKLPKALKVLRIVW